jgi:molybdate transport system substrate-binding protein
MRIARVMLTVVGLALLGSLTAPTAAQTSDLTVLSSTGLKAVMEALVPQFEKSTKHKVAATYDTAAALKQQIDAGASFDVAVLTASVMDDVIKAGKVAADSRTVIARSGMGLAIKAGTRKPEMETTDAFKRTLVNAKSITYTKQGASGVYFAGLIDRLGLAEQLKPRITLVTSADEVGEAVASGKVEFGALPVSEILPIHGAQLGGTFPAEVQSYIVMVAGAGSTSKHGDAARSLIKYLAAPAALPVIKAKGMERVP